MARSTTTDPSDMHLLQHLAELRSRLLISLLALAAAAALAYFYSDAVLSFLFRPFYQHFPHGELIGTGPADVFMLKLKAAFFSGIILASPVIFAQLWLFMAPGLYENERRLVLPFVFVSTLLFLTGVWFCFQVVFPFVFTFFNEQYESVPGITPAIRVGEHLAIIIQGLLGFGLIFELPVLAFFLARVGVIDHKTLIGGFRYAVVIIFVVAAILTPPDVVTQFLMAIPLLLLYGLSIVVVYYAARPRGD